MKSSELSPEQINAIVREITGSEQAVEKFLKQREHKGKSGQVDAIVREFGGMNAVENFLKKQERIQKFGHPDSGFVYRHEQPEPEPDETAEDFVAVDRSIMPAYPSPDSIREIVFPDIESGGPPSFHIKKLLRFKDFFDKDENMGSLVGVYQALKASNYIRACLNLQDLVAIQKKGLPFFRRYFQGKQVFGWRTVVYREWTLDIVAAVVTLCENEGRVELGWEYMTGGQGYSGHFAYAIPTSDGEPNPNVTLLHYEVDSFECFYEDGEEDLP